MVSDGHIMPVISHRGYSEDPISASLNISWNYNYFSVYYGIRNVLA